MELKDYTIEELEAEIKRRKKEARAKLPKPEIQYAYIKGTIRNVRGRSYLTSEYYVDVDAEYLPLLSGSAKQTFKSNEISLLKGNFNKDTAPKKGDRVLIRSRITRDNPTGWGMWFNPFICQVLEE